MIMTNLDTSLDTSRAFNREAQYTAKRRAVIRAASGAFRRRGYHNTSMVLIAQSLGLSKAALYYYVKSKEEILYECHIMVYDAMDAAVKSVRGQGKTGQGKTGQGKTELGKTGLGKLQLLYGAFAHLLTRDGLGLLADVDSLKGEFQTTVLKRRGSIERAVTRIVKQGMGDGSIKKADAKVTVFFLMGALNWLNVWYEPGGRLSGGHIADAFVAQMSQGIAA